MLLTEEEAKTKWCPHAGPNRFDRQTEYCEGSICMAWRWRDWNYENIGGIPVATTPSKGFCGLAGKPEGE